MSGNISEEVLRLTRNGRYDFAVHGQSSSWLGQYQARQRRRSTARGPRQAYSLEDLSAFELRKFADAENLASAWIVLRAGGGHGPGLDGHTYDDYSRSEMFALLRDLERQLLGGDYRPGPTRQVRIPKGDGRFRELQLPNITDRVLAKALQMCLDPYLTSILPGLHRSPWQIWAEIETIVRERQWFFLATDDIRDCFSCLRTSDILAAHRPHLTQPDLYRLFETLVRGHDGPDRVAGLHQGSPLSPAAAELTLHTLLLDSPTDGNSPVHPSLRYVDNLTHICRDANAGKRTLKTTRKRLANYGLNLKGTDGKPFNLKDNGHNQPVLGLCLKWEQDHLVFQIPGSAYGRLEEGLASAAEQPNPPMAAQSTIEGWMTAVGPAYDERNANRISNKVLHLASQYGFRELPRNRILSPGNQAFARWISLREETWSKRRER